jgi:hypothetical protein
VELDATGTLSMDAVGNSNLTIDQGNLTLSTTTSGNMVANSFGSLDLDAGAAITIDSANNGVSIDGAQASNFSTAAGALTLDGAGGVNIAGNAAEIDVTTSGALDLNSGAGSWNASTLVLEGTDDVKLESLANDGADKSLALRSTNSGGGAATLSLRADDHIDIGDGGDANCLIRNVLFTSFDKSSGFAAEVAGEALAQGDACVMKWDNVNSEMRWYKADANAAADQDRFCHGVATFAAANAGDELNISTGMGTQMLSNLSGLAGADSGKPVYVSSTAGSMTLTAPTGAGESVVRIGFVKSHNGGPGGTATVVYAPQFIAKRP